MNKSILKHRDTVFTFRLVFQIHREKLPQYLLPLKRGDVVSYVLAEAAGQASAISARLLRFSPRSHQDMEDFFRDTSVLIRTSAANQVYTSVIQLLFFVNNGEVHSSLTSFFMLV
jgi:hypothetical protein